LAGKFSGKIWRENLAGKFGGRFWRENWAASLASYFGGKFWREILNSAPTKRLFHFIVASQYLKFGVKYVRPYLLMSLRPMR
jgi:hypothetical protein